MVARTKIARRRFLAAMAGISATVMTERASANSVDWRNLSGNDPSATDIQAGVRPIEPLTTPGAGSSRSQTLCFLEGTSVATPNGPRRIEDLRVGQFVLNAAGQAKPVKWLGHSRRMADQSGNWTADTRPITIEAGAISDQVPARDLHVSPEHAIYLDGILIPAKHLVNGITIYPMDVRNVTTISYYHLELDAHDAVLAEGLAAETYRDTGQRASFERTEAHQGFSPSDETTEPFAPLVALHRRRDAILSHLRSAGSILLDQRGQFEMTRDRLFDRAIEIEELRSNSLAA